MMRSAFEELKNLIDYIQSVYSIVTDEWLQSAQEKINLRETQVSDIGGARCQEFDSRHLDYSPQERRS